VSRRIAWASLGSAEARAGDAAFSIGGVAVVIVGGLTSSEPASRGLVSGAVAPGFSCAAINPDGGAAESSADGAAATGVAFDVVPRSARWNSSGGAGRALSARATESFRRSTVGAIGGVDACAR
jgi:hypothetical protein